MGNVERCDTTLPTNEMMFYVRRDPALRARWLTDLPGIAKEFGLSRAEYEAIRDQDPKRLMDLGLHQYYVPQILRLFFGAAQNENASAAPVLPARLPGGDGEGDGAPGPTGGHVDHGADRRGDGDDPLPRAHRLVHARARGVPAARPRRHRGNAAPPRGRAPG